VKYAFTLTEPGRDREKIVLESRSGESTRHVALKVLAYLLFRHEVAPLPLRIEQKVGQRHKPDLVALDPETGDARLWVDCGQIETERLGRIVRRNPRTRVVVVKPTARDARLYALSALKDLPTEPERLARVAFVGFGPDFLADFLRPLRGANDLTFAREPGGEDAPEAGGEASAKEQAETTARATEETARLTLNGEAFVTSVVCLSGGEKSEVSSQ
jgi:hypothetical protein